MRTTPWLAALAASASIIAAACGGGGDGDDKTASASTAARTGTPASAATKATGASTPAPGQTPAAATTAPTSSAPAPTAPAPSGRVFDETQAKALIDAASLKPADAGAGWTIMADTPTDNATAAASDPVAGASFERCGRLAGRVIANAPPDVTNAYITGELVSVFSQLTVYKTADGAADCAAEGAQRFAAPGALARAFGSVFVNPDAVTVKTLEFPQVADGSFAAALTGDINAGGLTVQLQIVIVAFRSGNTTAVVGVAYSPLTNPSTAELKPYVDLVAQRVAANQ